MVEHNDNDSNNSYGSTSIINTTIIRGISIMFIEKAIFLINPDAKFGVINDDIDNIKWYDGNKPNS